MFFGRKTELKQLNEMHQSDRFEFAVIYGRRRVGKTTLIREFIKDKKAIFFAASESSALDNLISLSRRIGGRSNAPVYGDFEAALTAVFDAAANERVIFVIDEFPYLAEAHRGISSLLQILIDHNKDDSKLMLILCGSSMSFMENQVLGYQSPLYGRRTAQFKVLPFTFFESLPAFEGFEPVDKAVLYGAAGGVPEYLRRIDPMKSVRSNIIGLFLSPSGHFFEEPSNLLKQELREPSTYNVIIEAIASGSSRLNEISTKAGIESNKCAKYLSSLIALGLVSREYPYGEMNSKRGIYRLKDNMFRFWYRFAFPNISAITVGLGEAVYDNEIEPRISAYMGLIFEDICKQWFYEMVKKNELPFFANNFGRWWGTNPETRGQEEIDIIALRNDDAIFAECKWKNSDADIDVYHELKRKSDMWKGKNAFLYIFSKYSFTKTLRSMRHAENPVTLVSLSDMIDSLSSQ